MATVFSLRWKSAGAWAVAVALAATLPFHPAAAVETNSADQPSKQSDSKSRDKPDKHDGKAADKSDTKSADKSDNRADESESPPEGYGEEKLEDPCEPKKLLINFELRQRLCQAGVKLGVIETSEVLANPSGGLRQGAIYEGVTDLSLALDLRKPLHLRGNVFARAYQIHGRGLTLGNTANLNEISGIEALATSRLVELWYEQHFDNWRLRVGQQTIGTEFLSAESSRVFINGALGWPTQPAIDLPTGGPGYPLGTPAVRLRVDPEKGVTLFLAMFNADPTGAGVGGSQLRDASGTAFRTNDGAFVISELRYNPDSSDRKGTYRFGGWWNSERFRDLHLDTNGVSLASPGSNGRGRQHNNDFGGYGIIDQPFFFNEADHSSANIFARAMGAPGDRNLVDLYIDGGVVYKGPFGRADDEIGLGFGYAKIGNAARAFDGDVVRFSGAFHPIRSGETVLELTYRFQLTGWWQLQPDFQYVFNPSGGIVNPNAPSRRVADAAVVGLRTAISF
jgi:porin